MTPQQIAQLSKQSPTLREALQTHKYRLWRFLRDEVHLPADQFSEWIVLVCRNCLQYRDDPDVSDFLLQHPFSWPDYGWCLDCVLQAFLSNTERWQLPDSTRDDYFNQMPEGAWWS